MHKLVPGFILENFAAGRTRGELLAVGMFVDISGFSAMTEALMAHGQHGAEVLAGVMRATLEPLILAVFEQAGFVITQAGDSFSALFPLGDDPQAGARRALAAAWAVRQRAAAHSVHSTPYGALSVSVKVGLALGEVTWGIVSSEDGRRAACYFGGAAVDGSAESEHQADPGDVILDADTYEQVQALVDAEPLNAYYRLLDVIGDLPGPQEVIPGEYDLELAGRFFPPDLLEQSLSGEFRVVTYLFISLPTVRTQAQLDLFMQNVFELQNRYGGLLKLQFGDKGVHLLLIWGAPVAHENDILRALNFALALQTQTAIPISGGMTRRMAHAGFIGSPLAEEYAAFGRGVNLAARFMTSAPRGDLWLDENTAAHAQARYEIEYLGEKTFKGFAQPQKVYALLERKERGETLYDGALVGRDSELTELLDFVDPIFSGAYAGMLVVWGEPGMGKSRLVHEFLACLEEDAEPGGFQVFVAQSDEILRQSFNPFHYWLMRYFNQSDGQSEARNKRSFNRKLEELIAATQDAALVEELDRTRSFLGALIGLEWPDSLYEQLDAEARYENTQIGLITLLQAESRRAPLVLLLEDVHWLDPDSRVFLPRLMRALTADEQAQYPVAILCTARLEGADLLDGGFPVREISLDRLSRTALARLSTALLGQPASERLLGLLEARAEGNPFFAEQILRYLQETGLLAQSTEGLDVRQEPGQVSLPRDVSAVLVARLDRLSKEVKEVVQTAAVLGREFEVLLLAEMLKSDARLGEKVERAEQQAIWSALTEIRYIFRHAMLRDAAYNMQLQARRRSLHALAVEALESVYAGRLGQQYGELAYHADRAGLVDKAQRYFQLAGDEARDGYQNFQAVDYYSRALDLTPEDDLQLRCQILFARDAVYELLGVLDERRQGLEILQGLATQLGKPAEQANVALRWAIYAYDRGDFPQAIKLSREAIDLAPPAGEIACAIKAYSLLGSSLSRQGKLDEAIQHAKMGLELARHSGDRLNEVILLNSLGLAFYEKRDLAAARNYFERSLSAAQAIGAGRTRALPQNNLGMVAGNQGDYSAALEYYRQSLEIARETGMRHGEGIVLGNLGWISGMLGEYRQAREYSEQHLRIAREIGDQYGETYAWINLSSFLGALGDYEASLKAAERGQELAQRIGDRSAEAWALTYLGHSRLDCEQNQEAVQAYQGALDIRRELDQPVLATEPQAGLARMALAAGDLATAREHVRSILAYLDGGNSLDGADQPWLVYLTCYEVLEASGDRRAGQILNAAYSLLQERAANIQADDTRKAFLENIENNREIILIWESQPD